MADISANTITAEVTVQDQRGLHLRLASEIVRECAPFSAVVTITAPGKNKAASARSALALMSLAAPCGSRLTVSACGEDAADALGAMQKLFARQHP